MRRDFKMYIFIFGFIFGDILKFVRRCVRIGIYFIVKIKVLYV